jgi:hypothetical protein
MLPFLFEALTLQWWKIASHEDMLRRETNA